jgi:nucleotide-binding universal stress UspA family protein
MIKIDRILCPVDFSHFSAKALDYAYSFARRYRAALYLQHVIRPLTEYSYHVLAAWVQHYHDESRAQAEEALRKLVEGLASGGPRPEFVIQVGFPADAILEFAAEQAVDLIVMGTQGRRGADRWMLGSVTERVMRKAKCPVLAVRRPAHDFVVPAAPEDPVHLRKILLATDFSDHGQRALAYAISLAMEYQAELTLLHVLEELPQDEELATASARLMRDLETPVPADARNYCRIQSVIRVGKPYQEIIQLAVEEQTDLVILGVRGRGALDLAVFGSTAHRVLQLGPCPVLAVHLEARGQRAG